MHPTRKNDTCWLQKAISISKPHQWTAISKPRVTGSFFPTRSKTILMVHCKEIQQKNCNAEKLADQIFWGITHYQDFPHAVETEEMSQDIEVLPLKGHWPPLAFLHISQGMSLYEELPGHLFQCSDFESQLANVCTKCNFQWISKYLLIQLAFICTLQKNCKVKLFALKNNGNKSKVTSVIWSTEVCFATAS